MTALPPLMIKRRKRKIKKETEIRKMKKARPKMTKKKGKCLRKIKMNQSEEILCLFL